ncbi:glycosyltransferase involved in cell wall biosynthesis [Pseudomonas sp. SJZ080]|uniref:glycosyltransferase family 4 protein n=1 Tax=Pseudomonas sp. SJZ080 TaxID=2572888 RepID=UPI00119912CC|nr:glycosyltransferase family 4 protein [Pseudomonas sp. SJZ080]TWC53432.1 glycosyltransferase involved in cell wall biosynthesis [Pseudomonas sp. SJZ080]
MWRAAVRRGTKALGLAFGSVIFFLLLLPVVYMGRRNSAKRVSSPHLVWGDAPIISNPYWARIMKAAGYCSYSFTDGYCYTINKREDYDRILADQFPGVPYEAKKFLGFLWSLLEFDVFFISFNGFLLGGTPLWRLESYVLRAAGKKVVVMPFGLDSYIYNRVRSTELLHGLMMSIPAPARRQGYIGAKVDYWCEKADAVIPGIMWADGFGRWDALVPSVISVDESEWDVSKRNSPANGIDGVVYIAHAPNHRGFKGSEFVLEAVRILQAEGVKVELILIEGKQNSEVKRILREQADILVEQIICPGHGLNALEGMASGLTVVCNLENDEYMLPLRRWSYFGECPLVSASPENLAEVLRKLIHAPELRQQLGGAGREYIEKYQGATAATFFYGKVIDYLYGRESSIIQLFHPLHSVRMKELGKIEHPLINSRLPE